MKIDLEQIKLHTEQKNHSPHWAVRRLLQVIKVQAEILENRHGCRQCVNAGCDCVVECEEEKLDAQIRVKEILEGRKECMT